MKKRTNIQINVIRKKNGWNKVYAPTTNSRRYSAEKSLAQEAYDNQVSYTSLLYRVNKVGETVEEAIKHLKNNANKPTEKYEYIRGKLLTILEKSQNLNYIIRMIQIKKLLKEK